MNPPRINPPIPEAVKQQLRAAIGYRYISERIAEIDRITDRLAEAGIVRRRDEVDAEICGALLATEWTA